MPDQDLMFRPAGELAQLVKTGEISAAELVETSVGAIEERNPELNAFVDVFGDEAVAEAQTISADDPRPFAGVPIAIKNNRAVAGKRLTFAANFAGDFVAGHDSNVVAKLKQAGFVVVGTTTLPEWGIMPTTETARFGATRNPWDTTRTSGGSSGGSSAAVAGGMVPIAHANDGGGSTRIPAACCGLVGLKPQRGRISTAPETGEVFLVTDGVLTRTVEDTARVLDLISGPVTGDSSWAPPPAEPFAETAAHQPGGLKIAMTLLPPLTDATVDPQVEKATRETADLLRSLGHEVVEDDPDWQRPDTAHLFTALFGPAVCTQIAMMEIVNGRPPGEGDMEPLSWAIWNLAKSIDSVQAMGAGFMLQAFARQIVTWASQYDAVLTPALAELPLPLGTMSTMDTEEPMAGFTRSAQFTPFTAISNVTGSPAISVPLAQSAEGLPIGVQLIGRPAQEGNLLALATQLEFARPWASRRPGD
ncbi:MAG: amidase [Baekduia sp.]